MSYSDFSTKSCSNVARGHLANFTWKESELREMAVKQFGVAPTAAAKMGKAKLCEFLNAGRFPPEYLKATLVAQRGRGAKKPAAKRATSRSRSKSRAKSPARRRTPSPVARTVGLLVKKRGPTPSPRRITSANCKGKATSKNNKYKKEQLVRLALKKGIPAGKANAYTKDQLCDLLGSTGDLISMSPQYTPLNRSPRSAASLHDTRGFAHLFE